MNTNPLTKRQMEILNFMHRYFFENDQLPGTEAIMEEFGFASDNAVSDHRKALVSKGWIELNAAGKYRFVKFRGVKA